MVDRDLTRGSDTADLTETVTGIEATFSIFLSEAARFLSL